MPKYKPLYSLYKGLRESKYDVPDSYASFQKTLTQAGNAGAKSRRGLYQSLKDSNYDVPDTYEDFYKNLFVPVNSTTSRALKIGENPNTPTVNRYRQKMFNSVDPNNSRASELTHRAVGQAVRATNNVRKPVVAKVVNQKGKPTGKEFAITPAKTAEDLDREYAQETTKNWENELHDQMADADKDAAKISDMFKSFIGSTDEVGSVWGNMTRGGGIAGTPHSVTTNNGILENTEARQILAAGDYNRKRRELLQLEQDSRNGAIFDNHSFFRGMYDAAKDTGFLTGGASDLINAGSLLATKQDLDNGVHTEAGDMLMQQAVKNSDAQSQYGDNQGWMYTGGVITTNMAPFMVQIGSAGFSKGMSNAIGKVVQGTASKVALGIMEKATGMAGAHIANYIGKVTGLTTKAFGKAVQYGIVGAAQANTVGLGNVANDVINRYTGQVYQDEQGNYKFGTFDSDGNLVHEGGEDFLTALVKGDAAQTIEFATELAGGGIDAAGTALKNFVTKGGKKIINKYNMENVSKVIDFLLNNKVSKNARYLKAGADRTLGKVEVNSIVGESLEEELGIIANTVFTGDNKISDLWDEKQQSQIWGGMLLSIGLMKGAVAPFHAYNAKQYYSYKHKLDKADVNLSQLLGKEKWEELRNQIDATTNDDMPEMINKINRDVALAKNRQPVREYIQNLLIMRGYDIGNMLAAKKAVEDKGEGVSVKNMEKNQAYQQGRDAYGYDTHEIQLDQEDKQKSLAQLLGISEQQLASMSDEELEALSGRDDNIDRAIYDYQLSTARYEGVIDNARDQIDLEVQRAAQAVDMYTDKSSNTIRNATIKDTGGLEDYGVYIINGNIATHEDGSIDISNSDDMILYYDPTTNTVEHADAMMFDELGSEENADEVRSQAMADAKEKAIKETTGIIDGVVEVGTQFNLIDTDGTEHTYEVLADNGDGTAMITIDGNVPTELVNGENVNIPVSFEELQKMKDEYDQQRLQAAKAEREQMEKERAEQQTQEIEETQPSFDFNQILNDNGNVVLVDVLGKDGNTKYPDSRLFLIRDAGAKAKVVELKSDGTIVPHAVNKEDVATITSMSLDEYKQAMPESSMIENNSGENRGEIEVEAPTIEGEVAAPVNEVAAPESAETPATEQTPAAPAITLEDGTIVPMLEDGNPDFSKLTAAQTAELYDNQFGEDADSIVSGYVSDAKKALDKASNMTVKGKTFVEQKAAKDAKEKSIADAQAAYDSAIAIRDAYNERQLAKVEDTAEGRKELIEKARRKFARLKSAVKDDAEAVSQLYRETIGSLLHRLYDSTGIDVTDTIPLTAEEYVASNLGAHSLNYEGTETSKGVKQETGLSREDFSKTQLLAADGKGTTIDALVHSLWENRPSNLESLDTQDIRNALIGVLNSSFKASEARNFVENIRIAQAENILEEQKRAQENAAYAEQHKAEPEAELEAKSDEKAELKAKSEAKLDNESDNKSNDLSNETDNEKINDNINDNINAPEVPEDATDENPLGLQLSEDKVPFEIEGGKSGETYDINDNKDRQRLINDNKVDDKDILDIDMPKHVHKAIKELCKKMGLKVQFLYMGARSNGWIENGTMYLALDTEKATQFVFGHEMTHAIKQKNPEAYKELVKVAMAVTTKKKFEEDLAKVYQNYHGISGYNNVDDYVEEVVADNLGKFINDFDLAQKFSLRLNHPILGTILHAIQKIKSLLYGDFYKSVDALERIVEKAYVDTANGQVTNSETGEDVSFSLRQKPEPKKKGIGYKVFVLKDGKLYPPMVANPDGAATPVGVWLDADAAPIAGESKTGRPQVKQGGKGTQGGSGKLAYRPGWHLGVVPYAIQFNRKDAEGNKTLFPKNFVFAEVEYAADVDYQEEARQEGINPSGKYQHSLAGLKHLPTDGYYMYRTNPNPETDPWVITGAMKVNRILTRAEQADLVSKAGREPQQIQEGDIVTDDVVNSINQEIADAPKFSLKDNQENPLNQDGTLKLDKIKSVDELTDEDFTSAFRNVELPAIPKNVDAAIGANGKPIVIKKNIFEKNWNAHKFTPAESKKVLNDALYNTDLVGHTQPTKKPNHWVAIKLDDKSPITVLEVNDNKNNVEVVGWYTLDERNLGRIKRQAERNGGELIMLTPKDDKVESLSTPPLSSAANIINSFETTKENGEKVDVEGTKFSLKDEEYLKAVEDGNMEKAQKMVNEAADAAGYSTDSSYQGTSAFNGAAPWGNGYFLTKDERKEAWDNGEFEGESTLGDYINDDIDGGNLEELTNAASYRAADPMRKEAIDNVRNAIQKKAKTITMYRSVPSDVKEGSFRNGDWVTPSRAYAVDNAKLHGWGDDYNIIEQKVPVDDVWFDGNDIAEWGYGREEDYINDTDFAYKNSKNNKKLLDAVTYDDNGNVIPLSQRFNEKNKDVRFSLKDEKTLAGVHNITEEKLRKALKLGGFANPSLAVIDTNKTGHDNFGEISFIAPSALLDKRTGNTGGTWITDAYTQRYPSVEREMSEKGYRKFEDWVDSLDYPSGAKAEIERQAKDALSDNNAPAWELMYLKEKGIDIKEYDSRIDYRWKEIISDHPTAEDILNSMKTDPELNEKVTSLAKHAIIHPTWEKVSLEVRRKMYKETGVKASPINPQVRKQTKEIFERDYAPTLLNKDGSPRKKDVKKVVEDIVKEHNDTKKYDFYLSKVKASNYVNKNGLYDDYIRWQENKLDEFGTKNRIFRGYTRDGSRKYVPETLENVSKAMREEADGQTNGSEYTSFGSFIAKLASRVDSTDEMRANKDKLSSNKDKEEFYEKWSDVYYDLAKFLYNDVFYGEQRLHDIVLQSDPKKYAKKEYGITLTPTFMKKLDALKNAVQTELKSAYFETKYNRPLRLNEFAAAVVPDNLGKDVRKGIENAGLPMYDYDPNKEGDRSRAFNEAINSSDNIRFSLAGVRGAAAADKAEERNARMDNLSVARKMEEEKKDAKAIKMATGWERGADGKWRYEIPDAKIKDTMNVGGGQIVKRYEDDMLWNGGKLFDVIDAPELFKAYPQLKGVRIDTDAIMNDMPSHGEYDSKTNTITIHADELKYMNDILNHEIQHAIQGIEGFATGGSPTTIRGEVKKRFNEVTKQIKQLRAEGKEDEAKALIEKNRGLYNAYMKNDDFNSYKSLAGEVEARNVQERMNMTPEERRKTLAESTEDVARKDQIFLGVGDVSFSLRDMADGKESGSADMAEDLKSLNTPDEVDDAIKTAIEDMPSGWKMANKKMIHIAQALGENRKAEIAGEEPKFSLKDGTLIKAGTYFSGGGLVEEGLKGIIDPVVAVEYDEKISGVYRNNFGQHIVTADVRDVDPRELVKQIDGEVEYFHASPVCKNYSQAKSNHAEVELDKETAASTAEFINAIKPKVVTIENVKGYKDSEAMKTITDALDANGYTWDADVYNAADYGGYTNRERLIVRAVRDGKLPAKPEKMARKSGWYEAVADIIPTLTEKKNGVAPWMDIRLKADGIDWRNIDKPLYVMGSAYADGKVPHAFADELLPTLRTKSGDVIVMPDGKVYRALGRVLARVSGVSDDYKMPFSENLSHTIIGNGIPTQLTEHVIAPLLQNTLRPTTPDDGNTRFSLRYDQFEHDLNQWKKDNNLPKDAQRPTIPQRNAGESAVDFLRRVDEYRKQMALWKTAPTYEQHLLSDDTALGEFNRELQRGSVLKRIAFQDSMLAIRKAQEAIMKEVGVDRLNMAEDAYTAENRSHGKGKNEFEEYNNEFLQPLRKAYHQMKKVLGDSYDNVRIYMMAKHGLERDAQMAFKKSLDADYEDVAQRSAAYKAYKGDMNRIINDSDLEFGRVDFTTWRQRDNALRVKYSPSYMDYRYDKNGIAYDYSGLSALFDGSDFEEDAYKLVKDIEDKYVAETHNLWDATNAATKKILRDGYKAGMMSKDTYQYVRDMYSHYIPLRGWDGTTADQVWDYVGGGKGAFNQTLKTAHGRASIADDPIAYIENMAESGILLNNKNWVKQHLMLLAQNHPTSLLTLSKAWYVKSTDANGNEEWIPATPQITSLMNSNQVKAAIDAFEKKMEQMEQTGDATQKRDGLNIAYPQTHSEEREHEVRVMKDGEEYVIYVNGDPQLAQAMNNTRAHRVSEGIKNSISKRVIAVVGRKMAAAYTSLSPLFIPSNYFRDLTMTLASTAIREDAKYNYLLRKNLATSWNLGFMLRDFQNGKLRDKVNNGNATPKEQMFYDFMMNGGETGFVSSLDVEDLKKKFKNDLKDLDRWKANPVKVGHTIMDSIEFLNRMIEDSNRFAVYMTSIQYGRSIDEAVNDAKDVTLNFNRKGTGEHSWQTIRNLYLFINPAVQSLQTLGALAKHHPFKFTAVTASWLASGVLVPIVNVALMQLGAAFLGGDGDDDNDWYKDISKKYWQFTKWDRRNNFIMWVPTTHEFVKIPLAQEFRAFYGLGDMIASKMMGGELAEESWEDYGWDLVGQVVDMLPLDPTGYDGELGVSLMPNPIRPVFELAFNVDFTGKPLFKDTEYNKYDPNFTKAYVGTPDWLVRASRMMNSIGNDYPNVQQNKWDALGNPRYNLNNPAVVDHVLSSYLGGAYTMGSQVLGLLTKSLNDRKEIKVADIPLFSKFVSNPDDRPVSKKQGDEFWDKKEYYDRASNTISKLKKQAKIDGDYSLLERFYGSEEYKTYKLYEKDVKDYKEARKKERAEESGDEYRPHQLNAEDIYNNHATPMDEFEDMKLKQLFEKLNSFKTRYDAIVDNAPNESDGYYNTNKTAIDAIDEISLDKQEISELKKGFLDDGKDAYNAEDMKQIRDLRKKILSVLEKANKVVVANQKAKAKK